MVLLSSGARDVRGQEEFRLGLQRRMDRHGATLNGQEKVGAFLLRRVMWAKAER